MIEAHDLVWVLFASMFWASLAILLVGIVEAKGIVNLLRIPFPILAPAILIFATIGAFALRSNIIDVYTMFAAGVIGFFMRRRDYSIPALVMGVILGQIGEDTFSRAMVLLDYNVFALFTKPISGVLVVAALVTIFMNFRRYRKSFSTYRKEVKNKNA